MTKLFGSALAAATLLVGIGVAGPAPAAPGDDPRAVNVGGEAANGAMLTGHFVVTRISLGSAGQLLADGTVTGALNGPPGHVQTRVSQAMTMPIDRGATVGHCRMLDLYLGPADAVLAGLPVHVDRTDLNIALRDGPGSRLGVPLCAAADLLPTDDVVGLRDALGEIVRLLGVAAGA